jgi:hypothetical protein
MSQSTEIQPVESEIEQEVDSRVIEVCAEMERGSTYRGACKDLGMNPSAVWAQIQGSDVAKRMYDLARARAAAMLADETIEIADKAGKEDGVDPIRAAESAIKSRQWWCSKADPATYGDKAAQVSATVQVAFALGSLADLTD